MSGERNNTGKESYRCLVCNEEFFDLDSYRSHKEGSEKDFLACKKWNSTSVVEEDLNNHLENNKNNSPRSVENINLSTPLENYNSSQLVEENDLKNLLENLNLPQLLEEEDLNILPENSNSPQLVEKEDLNNHLEIPIHHIWLRMGI